MLRHCISLKSVGFTAAGCCAGADADQAPASTAMREHVWSARERCIGVITSRALYYAMMHAGHSAGLSDASVAASRQALDVWVRDVVEWHFDPATGCPFWLDFARSVGWDP